MLKEMDYFYKTSCPQSFNLFASSFIDSVNDSTITPIILSSPTSLDQTRSYPPTQQIPTPKKVPEIYSPPKGGFSAIINPSRLSTFKPKQVTPVVQTQIKEVIPTPIKEVIPTQIVRIPSPVNMKHPLELSSNLDDIPNLLGTVIEDLKLVNKEATRLRNEKKKLEPQLDMFFQKRQVDTVDYCTKNGKRGTFTLHKKVKTKAKTKSEKEELLLLFARKHSLSSDEINNLQESMKGSKMIVSSIDSF